VGKLVKARYEKFRRMGRYTSRIRVAISKEGAQLQEFISQRLEELEEYLPEEEVPLEEEEPSQGD